MKNFCPDCGSPSWRNGPCWYPSGPGGGDPPCVGRAYDENFERRRRQGRQLFAFCALLIATIVTVLIWAAFN